MKKWLHEILICPNCLPEARQMQMTVQDKRIDDVQNGQLTCPSCNKSYPINKGVAILLPGATDSVPVGSNGYNSRSMLSAYLWSHYCDLLNDPKATDAYELWTKLVNRSHGIGLDIGCAVGRLSFEMSRTHQRVIGIDTSYSFIYHARELLDSRHLDFNMIIEGNISENRQCDLPQDWQYENVEFIVADAMALPFQPQLFSTVSSINILEKVPNPIQHITEANRVLSDEDAMFIFSDPFSWDESVSTPDLWLGGKSEGEYAGRGLDVISRLFSGKNKLIQPQLDVVEQGAVSWKIRKTENLWESITSQYIVGKR